MVLYIIRHGEKKAECCFNPEIRHYDPPLSSTGEEQAKSLVGYFKDKSVAGIYVSQYLRAQQTAEYLSLDKGLSPIIEARLNEIDNGVTETMTDEDVIKNYPEFWSDYWNHTKDYRFPGGETGEDVKVRQDSLLNDLVTEKEDCILICHEGYIRLLMCNLLGMPVFHRYKFKYDFCGIMEIEYREKEGDWRIKRFNQITY